MLACERWTLTQSSGWSAALAWLALALLLGLLSGLAMSASREAETVAAAELCDDDADAEPAWDGEPVGDVDERVRAQVGEQRGHVLPGCRLAGERDDPEVLEDDVVVERREQLAQDRRHEGEQADDARAQVNLATAAVAMCAASSSGHP